MKDLVLDHVLTVGIDEIDEDHNKWGNNWGQTMIITI
jgi:hypothetical protein